LMSAEKRGFLFSLKIRPESKRYNLLIVGKNLPLKEAPLSKNSYA